MAIKSRSQMVQLKTRMQNLMASAASRRQMKTYLKSSRKFLTGVRASLRKFSDHDAIFTSKIQSQLAEETSHFFLGSQRTAHFLKEFFEKHKESMGSISVPSDSDETEKEGIAFTRVISNISSFKQMIIAAMKQASEGGGVSYDIAVRNKLNIAVTELHDSLYSAMDNVDRNVMMVLARTENLCGILSDLLFNHPELIEPIILDNMKILNQWLDRLSAYMRKV